MRTLLFALILFLEWVGFSQTSFFSAGQHSVTNSFRTARFFNTNASPVQLLVFETATRTIEVTNRYLFRAVATGGAPIVEHIRTETRQARHRLLTIAPSSGFDYQPTNFPTGTNGFSFDTSATIRVSITNAIN